MLLVDYFVNYKFCIEINYELKSLADYYVKNLVATCYTSY